MATKFLSRDDAPTYEGDAAAWAMHQAELIRSGRFDEIDGEHLAQEIESLAKSEFRVLTSALAIVIQHILKWEHQPERRGASWATSIREHRRRIEQQLRDNPSFRRHLAQAVEDEWPSGVYLALFDLRDLNFDKRYFPETCPYTWEDLMNRSYDWPEA